MGYDIYIGEAVTEVDEDGEFRTRVHGMNLPEAPTFPNDHMTGNGNSRHPSYTGWSNFCRTSGLYDLFFDEEIGLMRQHPGCITLKQAHLEAVRYALKGWKEQHPGANPGFTVDTWMKPEFQNEIKNPDPILARLIWLEFWFSWALKNCKQPAIHNH